MTNGNDRAYPTHIEGGLTKREYFAAMAMQGLISSFTVKASLGMWQEDIDVVAQASVKYAAN